MRSAPVDGFRLAHERAGSGPPVVLLHGWPGDHTDYRAGSGMVASSLAETDPAQRIATPATVLWQSDDPLFPREWADRLDRFFSQVELRPLDGVGHFTPLEAPQAFADAIGEALAAL